MEREVLFAQTLEQVRRTARKQGNCISEIQVQEAFEPLHLDKQQLEMVLDYLDKHHIGIDEPGDQDAFLTQEERDYLQDYLEEISLLPQLTDGEKEALTLSAMAGEKDAQKKLIEVYLPDVVEIARLYTGQGVCLEDLVGEGNVTLAAGTGMLGCLEHAYEAQGMLARMIMDAMEDFIEDNAASEKTDQKVAERVNRVMEKARELAEDLNRKITPLELARETGMSINTIMEAVCMSGFQIDYIEVQADV